MNKQEIIDNLRLELRDKDLMIIDLTFKNKELLKTIANATHEKNQIPKEFISCKICLHADNSIESCCCGECVDTDSFVPDFDKICKWCWNKVANGDNICAEHRKSHAENSWPGVKK